MQEIFIKQVFIRFTYQKIGYIITKLKISRNEDVLFNSNTYTYNKPKGKREFERKQEISIFKNLFLQSSLHPELYIHPIFFSFFHGTTLHTYKFHTLYFFTKFPRSPINNYWSHHRKIDGKMKPNRIQISAQIESGLRGSFVMLRRASSIEFNVRVHVNIVYYGVEASSKSRLRWSRAPSRAIEVSLGFRPGRDIRPWQKLCS